MMHDAPRGDKTQPKTTQHGPTNYISFLLSATMSNLNNYSIYAIPAAWVLCFAPHVYATRAVFAKSQGKEWDNSSPRYLVQKISSKTTELTPAEAMFLRAAGAQQNGFENVALFAVSVLAGNVAKLPASHLNKLAFGYLATRVVYNFLYINISTNEGSRLRSASFLAGIICCMTLILQAGAKFN
ncbi:hypothetical protein FIBSPDRAFT_848813 [Athelia psychrophila]|uniref:Membrane-associated proteins in eicosanoid and glutathione metabolism n=1 Tax=Athelia psychrophila TaxID=1759441 RepID=A0A166V6V2_9AGAM|nr:hypothetical protein FIBSPDRAFT_848813 [Fibularhizoctonia sp. CBS 109695]